MIHLKDKEEQYHQAMRMTKRDFSIWFSEQFLNENTQFGEDWIPSIKKNFANPYWNAVHGKKKGIPKYLQETAKQHEKAYGTRPKEVILTSSIRESYRKKGDAERSRDRWRKLGYEAKLDLSYAKINKFVVVRSKGRTAPSRRVSR